VAVRLGDGAHKRFVGRVQIASEESNLKLTFYDFDEYTRLVQAAQQIGARSARLP
jgi:hypothetical protein